MPANKLEGAPSRGDLPVGFLQGSSTPAEYAAQLNRQVIRQLVA